MKKIILILVVITLSLAGCEKAKIKRSINPHSELYGCWYQIIEENVITLARRQLDGSRFTCIDSEHYGNEKIKKFYWNGGKGSIQFMENGRPSGVSFRIKKDTLMLRTPASNSWIYCIH